MPAGDAGFASARADPDFQSDRAGVVVVAEQSKYTSIDELAQWPTPTARYRETAAVDQRELDVMNAEASLAASAVQEGYAEMLESSTTIVRTLNGRRLLFSTVPVLGGLDCPYTGTLCAPACLSISTGQILLFSRPMVGANG
jgi:hypothetical protein